MYINLPIKVPNILERICVWFLLRYRKKHYGCAFRRIKLIADRPVDAKHRYAIIDPDDYQKLSEHNWQLFESKSKNYYAVRLDGRQIVSMHREIMDAPAGKIVDHRDGEGLNNTKENLRFATASQNKCNAKPKKNVKNCTSKYRGVSRRGDCDKWVARIAYDGKTIYLGDFEKQEDAARAYDEAAKIYHGEFAVLNFEKMDEPRTYFFKQIKMEENEYQTGAGLTEIT